MLRTVADAVQEVLAAVQPFESQLMPLQQVLGLALAADVTSEIDSPPFDKALMDGYAIRSVDLASGRAQLRVVERIMAGQVPQRKLASGEATQLMTGAPLPAGSDCVIKVEETSEADGMVTITTAGGRAESNLMRRGTTLQRGATLLQAGTVIRPPQLAALAEVGCSLVPVRRPPVAAVLATGDELVPVDQTPGPGQIRNSNEPMVAALIEQWGGIARPLGIAPDRRDELARLVQIGLQCDVLVLSGGVSAGERDLVPAVLADLGVKCLFHGVRMKPGKPMWFGILPANDQGNPCAVFALPGNPVSTMVCAELFVHPAFRRLMGKAPAERAPIRARLKSAFTTHGDRPVYHPASLEWTNSGPRAEIVPWQGSADLAATVRANAMIYWPVGERRWECNDEVDVFPWD